MTSATRKPAAPRVTSDQERIDDGQLFDLLSVLKVFAQQSCVRSASLTRAFAIACLRGSLLSNW